jgi:hypothetical protein
MQEDIDWIATHREPVSCQFFNPFRFANGDKVDLVCGTWLRNEYRVKHFLADEHLHGVFSIVSGADREDFVENSKQTSRAMLLRRLSILQ